MQRGEVFLPPEVLLHLGTEGRQQVIRVHDDMHEGVQHTEECGVTTCKERHEHCYTDYKKLRLALFN